MKRSAFTLIELLVVIAIIAVLAAILFPVFAQAKLAAKKTGDLSNLKEIGLAAVMYAGDQDDHYPINTAGDGRGGYLWGWIQDLPWDLRGGQTPLYYEQNRITWGNSIQPYLRSLSMLTAPVGNVLPASSLWPDQAAQWVKRPGAASYAMNGLLEQWSTSAVARPTQLIAFSTPLGGTSFEGGNFAQPYLFCDQANKPCVYVPTHAGCNARRNGEISGTFWNRKVGANLRATFGNGSNLAFADGSAKFRRMGTNVNGKTDFRSDPYTEYDRQGNAALSWYDDSYCHPLLFRPDFEFQDYGSPVEGV